MLKNETLKTIYAKIILGLPLTSQENALWMLYGDDYEPTR